MEGGFAFIVSHIFGVTKKIIKLSINVAWHGISQKRDQQPRKGWIIIVNERSSFNNKQLWQVRTMLCSAYGSTKECRIRRKNNMKRTHKLML